MPLSRHLLVLVIVLCSIPTLAQNGPTNSRDPQALALLGQAVGAAGGVSALNTVNDYKGTGKVTVFETADRSSEGTVTLSGTTAGQLRMDSNLPNGQRSYALNNGRSTKKDENGKIITTPASDAVIPSSDAFPHQPAMFPGSLGLPYLQLAAVLKNPTLTLSYRGTLQLDGVSVHCIRAQQAVGGNGLLAEYNTTDFFLDASTLQLRMTQDVVPKHVTHQVRYSDYRTVSGLLVPFSISESLGGQPVSTIHFDQVSLNPGLPDSTFDLR